MISGDETRHVTASAAALFNRRFVEEIAPGHFRAFDPYRNVFVNWHVVADDDPRGHLPFTGFVNPHWKALDS